MTWGVYLLKKGMLLECLKFAQISEKWKRHAISDSNDKIVSMLGTREIRQSKQGERTTNKQHEIRGQQNMKELRLQKITQKHI